MKESVKKFWQQYSRTDHQVKTLRGIWNMYTLFLKMIWSLILPPFLLGVSAWGMSHFFPVSKVVIFAFVILGFLWGGTIFFKMLLMLLESDAQKEKS